MRNIIWFRNDLRILDNPALTAALQDQNAEVCAVFVVAEKQMLIHDWGANKIGFVLSNVLTLQQELRTLNVSLDILSAEDFVNTKNVLLEYLLQQKTKKLFFNCEYEINEIVRDRALKELLNKHDITCHIYHSQTLIAPGIILTKQQSPYTIFTPFKRAIMDYIARNPLQMTIKPVAQAVNQNSTPKVNSHLDKKLYHYLDNPILKRWPAGSKHALKLLENFCAEKICAYAKARDFPCLSATSILSPYLAIGALSAKQCFLTAIKYNDGEFTNGNVGITCWLNELIWRDFYKNILYHFPRVAKGQNFNRKYDAIRWHIPGVEFAKWQTGNTGLPIIDAAMRQLVLTGWMHNRLRMVVAMYLTKNLFIDWRYGEKFFAQHLIDLDLAANNGGWQWSASTGTDAVPYFRIFNPVTQSMRFDPKGDFIKMYCPELKNLNNKIIHNPSAYLSAEELAKLGYPRLMIDLSKSRAQAISYFKNVLV